MLCQWYGKERRLCRGMDNPFPSIFLPFRVHWARTRESRMQQSILPLSSIIPTRVVAILPIIITVTTIARGRRMAIRRLDGRKEEQSE